MEAQATKRPLYFTIKEDIKNKVHTGVYHPGDVLPKTASVRSMGRAASRSAARSRS